LKELARSYLTISKDLTQGDESGQGSVSKLGHSLWGSASLRTASSRGVVEQDRGSRRAPAGRVLLPTARCSARFAPSRAAGSVDREPKTERNEITAPDSFDRADPSRCADRADPDAASVSHQAATVDLTAVSRWRRATARNTVTWPDSCNVPRNHSNFVGSIKITIMI
jgi:hypothetical protein